MASWKEERDRLVAQTLAFVQQVAAAHPVAASKHIDETAEPTVEIARRQLPAPAERILDALPERVTHYAKVSERVEINERVAAFKQRQLLLNREREAYYETVQARIRNSLRNQSDADRL